MIDDTKKAGEIEKHGDDAGNGQHSSPCEGDIGAKACQCQQGPAEIYSRKNGGSRDKNVQDG